MKDQIQVLTTPELVIFTMIYTSQEARNVLNRDSNFDEKLDFILSKHIEQITSTEFAVICNSSAYAETDEPLFQSFLKESTAQAEQWLGENAFSLSEVPSVIAAYSNLIKDLDAEKGSSLKDKIQNCILDNGANFKVGEAVQLIFAVCQYADSQTIEVLDRIIGGNIHEVTPEQAFNALKAFMSSANSRQKIF